MIALIVTIILLLILSAITINLATKQNGIFNKAKIAQDKYDTAELKEKLEILKASLFMEDDNTERVVTLDMFLDAIRREMGISEDSIERLDSKTAVITCKGGKKLILTEADGDVRIDYEGDLADLALSATSGVFEYPTAGTFTIIRNASGGNLTVRSEDESIATASISGSTVTITPVATEGEVRIIVTSEANGEYEEKQATYTATVIKTVIELEATAYTGTYDGTSHRAITNLTVTPTDARVEYALNDGDFTTTCPEVTGADTYTITIKATKEGWTSKVITKTVTIGRNNLNGYLELSAKSGKYTYPTSGTFTVTKNVSGGALSVSSSNENIATASINGSTITITPQTAAGTVTITVKSAATSNYGEQTATYTAKVCKGVINLTFDKYIYIDAINGSDDGAGTEESPYKTLDKITGSGIIQNGYSYGVILKDGTYTLTNSIFAMSTCNKSINIIGNREKTIVQVNRLGSVSHWYSLGNTNYSVNFCRLVWDGQNYGGSINTISMCNSINFDAVAFINIPDSTYGYFIVGNECYWKNCLLTVSKKNFFRMTDGKYTVQNCYGGFTSGNGTSDSSWNDSSNYITSSPKYDETTYSITDSDDTWVAKGTGTNPDGTTANRGVYGGAYSWEYDDNIF